MKKITFALLFIGGGIAFKSLAQTSIQQITDPTKAQGYVCWQPVENATSYKIEYFDQSNPNNIILTLTTEVAYLKTDPAIYQTPGFGYKIVALQGTSVIGSTDPNYQPPGAPEDETVCQKICNGTSYAFGYNAFAEKHYTGELDGNGQPEYTLGNVRLETETAYREYDPANGITLPFYQAMSYSAYNALPQGHPYTISQANTASGYDYDHIPLPLNHEGVYLDAYNSPVQSGWLIEKRFDQFEPFIGTFTSTTADAGMNICSADVTGSGSTWINFFNSYVDASGVQFWPAANPFTGTTTTGNNDDIMECYGQWENVVDGGVDDEDWHHWWENLVDAVADDQSELAGINGNNGNLSWTDFTSVYADLLTLNSASGESVGSIVFTNLHDPSQQAVLYKDRNNTLVVDRSSSALSNDAYRITLLSDQGSIMPLYSEITKSTPVPQTKDFSTLRIYPNPIQNGELVFDISAQGESSFQFFVHNTNGTLIKAGTGTFNQDGACTIDKSVGTADPILILTILFNDGSVLQQNVQVQ